MLEKQPKTQVLGCFLVEVGGVEPPSESTLTRRSPGADDHFGRRYLPVSLTDGKSSRRWLG